MDAARTTPGGMPNEAGLESLSRRAAEGDVEAVQTLLTVYHGRLLGGLARKIGVQWQGKLEPEDVLQEAYADVFAHCKSFVPSGPESFLRWASQIVENRFIDAVRHLRRKKRDAAREVHAPGSSEAHLSFLIECAPEWAKPSLAVRREEAAGALIAAIAQLPEDQRVVVTRMHLRRERVATIAQDLGRSEDAVRRLADRALEKLQVALGSSSKFLTSA